MSSVFKRAYDLLRQGQINMLEDYFTEIISVIFEDKIILTSFFGNFAGVTIVDPTMIRVETQKTYPKLPGHQVDSRPDLVVQFNDGGKHYVAFFENKLDAKEGDRQLFRYSNHLDVIQREKGSTTFLFYITRRYDPKEVNCTPIRWYKVYEWLKNHRNPYVDKVILFMEEINLNQNRKFLPQDIYAIQQMDRLQQMMDECLDGPVDETMTRLFGKASQWSNRNVQLRDFSRYFKTNDQSGGLWVECGFQLTEDDYPLISVICEIAPNVPKRKDVLNAMKWFLDNAVKKDEWDSYDIDDDTEWAGIFCDVDMLKFLKENDHISAIQSFFMEKLEELYLIKNQFPDLGWKK